MLSEYRMYANYTFHQTYATAGALTHLVWLTQTSEFLPAKAVLVVGPLNRSIYLSVRTLHLWDA